MQEQTIHFPEGILGFGEYQNYLPIPLSEESDVIINLESVDERELSFLVMNPFYLVPDYTPTLSPTDYKKLGSAKEEDLSYYLICVPREPFGNSTVNLKCPIVVNSNNRRALQIILDNGEYGMRVSLKELRQKGGLKC